MDPDTKGPQEPLNDLGADTRGQVIRGTHLLHLGTREEAIARIRALANAVVLKPVLAFSDAMFHNAASLITRKVNTDFSHERGHSAAGYQRPLRRTSTLLKMNH